jgi:hypothetical protein
MPHKPSSPRLALLLLRERDVEIEVEVGAASHSSRVPVVCVVIVLPSLPYNSSYAQSAQETCGLMIEC